MTSPNVLDDLEWRGLVAHSTDLDALRAALGEGSVRFYVGLRPDRARACTWATWSSC